MRSITFPSTLLALLLCAGVVHAADDPRTHPVFAADLPLSGVLRAAMAQGKGLYVVLESGKRYAGKVKAVSDDAVILTEIQGAEFFDAYIRMDRILALEERVRMR